MLPIRTRFNNFTLPKYYQSIYLSTGENLIQCETLVQLPLSSLSSSSSISSSDSAVSKPPPSSANIKSSSSSSSNISISGMESGGKAVVTAFGQIFRCHYIVSLSSNTIFNINDYDDDDDDDVRKDDNRYRDRTEDYACYGNEDKNFLYLRVLETKAWMPVGFTERRMSSKDIILSPESVKAPLFCLASEKKFIHYYKFPVDFLALMIGDHALPPIKVRMMR